MSNRRRAIDSNEVTSAYFDEILIEMRHIDAQLPDLTYDLFGRSFKTPVMMAALSHLKGMNGEGDGMVAMAEGAGIVGTVNWIGMSSNQQYAEVAATGVPTIRIIKPYADENEVISRMELAEKLGALAIGMDLDHSFNWKGEHDNVLGQAMRPRSMDEIKAYCDRTNLPFIVKGVISVTDAKKCLEAGVSGIVVSHHHGISPSIVPPLMVLPEIAEAVGGKMQIFVDCGVMNGTDVFKALALGADAVCVGRPVMIPIREKGAEGAAEVISEITDELSGIMARTCSHKLKDIDSTVLWYR